MMMMILMMMMLLVLMNDGDGGGGVVGGGISAHSYQLDPQKWGVPVEASPRPAWGLPSPTCPRYLRYLAKRYTYGRPRFLYDVYVISI